MILTISEIVDIDAQKNHKHLPIEIVRNAFKLLCELPNTIVLQYRNTLLSLELLQDTTYEFHFINAAPFDDFVVNVIHLLAQAKEHGVEYMTTQFTNPKIIDVAEKTDYDYSISSLTNGYTMTVRL